MTAIVTGAGSGISKPEEYRWPDTLNQQSACVTLRHSSLSWFVLQTPSFGSYWRPAAWPAKM